MRAAKKNFDMGHPRRPRFFHRQHLLVIIPDPSPGACRFSSKPSNDSLTPVVGDIRDKGFSQVPLRLTSYR